MSKKQNTVFFPKRKTNIHDECEKKIKCIIDKLRIGGLDNVHNEDLIMVAGAYERLHGRQLRAKLVNGYWQYY
jgi:hypothetical protein